MILRANKLQSNCPSLGRYQTTSSSLPFPAHPRGIPTCYDDTTPQISQQRKWGDVGGMQTRYTRSLGGDSCVRRDWNADDGLLLAIVL